MEYPGGPELGLHTSTGGDTKSIPDRPTKILQTILCNQKGKKKEGGRGRIGTERRGNVIMEGETAVMQPQAKEYYLPPEAGRGKEQILPYSS